MDYTQTLDYLYHALPMFSHMGAAAYKKDLTNIVALCKHLDNPHQKFKTIHIGGTNGKGSVSHMLAAILQTAGYKTGLYTSPHLYDFRERIKINSEVVPEDFVIRFVENIKPVIERIQPSFFEITVAMAFQYFAAQRIDMAVVEVGLGGRLDSTNIIVPELSVITNISWDHMNILGNTLAEIATEKAGIIKSGVPVVIGEKDALTEPIFRNAAAAKAAPVYFAEDRFSVTHSRLAPDALHVDVADRKHGVLKKFALDLTGLYQTKNVAAVLQAVALLNEKGFGLEHETVTKALRNAKKATGLHGRWDVVNQKPIVVLDVAHNEAGIRQLFYHLSRLHYEKLHLVTGFVKDKALEAILALLPQTATFYFTHAHIPRALDAAELQQKAALFHLHGAAYADVNDALQQALTDAGKEDLIIVCGSIFLVAEVDTARLQK